MKKWEINEKKWKIDKNHLFYIMNSTVLYKPLPRKLSFLEQLFFQSLYLFLIGRGWYFRAWPYFLRPYFLFEFFFEKYFYFTCILSILEKRLHGRKKYGQALKYQPRWNHPLAAVRACFSHLRGWYFRAWSKLFLRP